MSTLLFIVAVGTCLGLASARSSRRPDDPNEVSDDKRSSNSLSQQRQARPPSVHIQPVYYPVYTIAPPIYAQPNVPNFSYPQPRLQSFYQPQHSNYLMPRYHSPQTMPNFNRASAPIAQQFPMSNNVIQPQVPVPPAGLPPPMSTSGTPQGQPSSFMNFLRRFTPVFYPGQTIRNDPRFPAGGIVTKTDGFGEANVLTPMGMAEVDGFEVSYDMGF